MDGDEFRQRLRAAVEFITDLGLMRTVSALTSLNVDSGFNEVALDPTRSYGDIYLCAVSRSYYNVMLDDYSLYQFSWENAQSWRLAYLPNPWIAGIVEAAERVREWESLESLGAYDQEEVASLISELPYFGSIPPIRFEYSKTQYKELSHPCAHIHVGRHADNRWALSKELNPLTFAMMITKQYYPERWGPNSSYFIDGEAPECLDAKLIVELERSRVVHDFTDTERRSLHFGAR